MQALTKDCPKLSSFKVSILRTTTFGGVEWEKKEGKWVGGVKEGKASVTAETTS